MAKNCKDCFHYKACCEVDANELFGSDWWDENQPINCDHYINVLTPDEFAEKMREIRNRCVAAEKSGHIAMDSLMEQLLISFGYEEGVKIFEETPKWYD